MRMTMDQAQQAVKDAADTMKAAIGAGWVVPEAQANQWPYFVCDAALTYETSFAGQRLMPEAEAIDRALVVIGWLSTVEERLAEIVWMRAEGHPWRFICQRCQCLRGRAWKRWNSGIILVAKAARGDSEA